MQIKIFDIQEGIITINENCLLIPELKTIYDTYTNPIPALCFVHYMTDPLGPYANTPEQKREEILLEDYAGDYTTDDEPIYKAVEKLQSLYETPTMQLMKDARKGLETLGNYLSKASIRDEDKGGNLTTFANSLKSIGKISQEFRTLEKEVQEELRIRGNLNTGYDEI
jgi:hypothetical protein